MVSPTEGAIPDTQPGPDSSGRPRLQRSSSRHQNLNVRALSKVSRTPKEPQSSNRYGALQVTSSMDIHMEDDENNHTGTYK